MLNGSGHNLAVSVCDRGNGNVRREFSGTHSGDAEDASFLGC
jgi:hypothetical protein